jgi:hypothetical protein
MTIFAHAAVSILSGRIFFPTKDKLKPLTYVSLMALCGILPDVPLLLVSLSGRFTPEVHHHEWVFHTPLFWMVVSLLVRIKSRLWARALIIGSLSHLATDWYGGGDGIMFLWPLLHEQYGVNLSGFHGPEAFRRYFSHPLYLGMELVLCIYLIYEFIKIKCVTRVK